MERGPLLTVVFSGFCALTITLLVLGFSRSWMTTGLEITRASMVFLASLAVSFLVIAGYAFALQRGVAEEVEDLETARLEALRDAHQRFVANVSHAIRNPLTGIVGSTHLLRDVDRGLGDTSPLAGLVEPVLGEVGVLSRMVDDLLTSANLDAGSIVAELGEVDVEAFVASLRDRPGMAGTAVEVDVRPALVAVDREILGHILRNLISNAVRYGGTPVEVTGSLRGTRYVFTVTDRGGGLPSAIATALTQGDRPPAGTSGESVGLGLDVVSRLARLCDFDLGHRRSGGCTHVSVSVPLSVNDPAFRALRGNRSIRDSLERLGVVETRHRGLAAPRDLQGVS